jgi:hypothetical protein
MAHIGEEFTLGAVGRFRQYFGLNEFIFNFLTLNGRTQ